MSVSLEAMTGLDPFDALRGTRIPEFIRRSRRLRQAVIQLRKRSRWDLAAALGVEPFLMAKTVGTFLSAEARRLAAGDAGADPHSVAEILLNDTSIARLGGGAWGYEFDVQTRWAFYPAGSVNIVATVFCARGLGEAAQACDVMQWRSHMSDAAHFVDSELRSDAGWYRYTQDSDVLVHNANLLGAGLCALSGALGGDTAMISHAVDAAMITVDAQHADGSWAYGRGAGLEWCDNFHTAYNLDSLLSVWLASGDERVKRSLLRGAEFWIEHFFGDDGAPRYYADGSGPFDVHSAGTAIDVAAKLAGYGVESESLAGRVAEWTRSHLCGPNGTTYYRWTPNGTDTRHFVRWGDAHVALGMSSLLLLESGRPPLLEGAVATEALT